MISFTALGRILDPKATEFVHFDYLYGQEKTWDP